MKPRHVISLAVAAVVALLFAAPGASAQPYTNEYVFGNSHVDVGNNYYVTFFDALGIYFPPSPPYLAGRASNGPLFPEVVAGNLGLGPLVPSLLGGTNYAHGAARSVDEVFVLGFIPVPSVRSQVESHLEDVGGHADPRALYLLEVGVNDVSAALQAGDWDAAVAVVEESAQGMVGSIRMLADAGAAHFIVPNVPFSSESAWTCGLAEVDILAGHYNTTLMAGLATLDNNIRVLYFDLAGFAKSLSDRFITGCSRCVPFGDLEPTVCDNPDELFYWDDGHFSAPVYQLIGDAITVAMLQDEVLHLVKTGALTNGNATALLAKLGVAYEKLRHRKPKTAANAIRAFANDVQALVRSRRLPADKAEFLLVAARGILDGA